MKLLCVYFIIYYLSGVAYWGRSGVVLILFGDGIVWTVNYIPNLYVLDYTMQLILTLSICSISNLCGCVVYLYFSVFWVSHRRSTCGGWGRSFWTKWPKILCKNFVYGQFSVCVGRGDDFLGGVGYLSLNQTLTSLRGGKGALIKTLQYFSFQFSVFFVWEVDENENSLKNFMKSPNA